MALFKLDQNKKYNTNKPKVGHQQHIVSPDNDSINSTQNNNGFDIKGDADFFTASAYLFNSRFKFQNAIYSIGNYFTPSQFNPGFFPANIFSAFVDDRLLKAAEEFLISIDYVEQTEEEIQRQIKEQEDLALSEQDLIDIENAVNEQLQAFDEIFL